MDPIFHRIRGAHDVEIHVLEWSQEGVHAQLQDSSSGRPAESSSMNKENAQW